MPALSLPLPYAGLALGPSNVGFAFGHTQAAADVAAGVDGAVAIPDDAADAEGLVLANVHWQMRLDRKTTGLKMLQGLVWQEAYASGAVKGEVYDDVVHALRRWKAEGRRVYIYSSGSVGAASTRTRRAHARAKAPRATRACDTGADTRGRRCCGPPGSRHSCPKAALWALNARRPAAVPGRAL